MSELLDKIDELGTAPGPSRDYSWFLAAVDRHGDALLLDAAQGFYDTDIFVDGPCAEDNCVYVPKGLEVGLYRVTNVRLAGGERVSTPNGDDWTDIEVSGTWEKIG